MKNQDSYQRFQDLQCCVLIPTYNNEGSLGQVIRKVLNYTRDVIVVVDGATDSSPEIVKQFPEVKSLTFEQNKGKGVALREGFRYALSLGYRYVISIDSDGQHRPEDLHIFLDKIEEEPGALLIGSRNMEQENVPGGSSFGNKFSNFWFWVETGRKLPDTQSGYRLYPLDPLGHLKYFTSRFEFEIEVLVQAAWRGILTIPVPITVIYPIKEERITHFRPFIDFFRISMLNTVLVLISLIYVLPLTLIKNMSWANVKSFFKKELMDPRETNWQKAASVGLGVFIGCAPIWGWQNLAALGLSVAFKLNKIITIAAANISIPPMFPFILLGSYMTGGWILGHDVIPDFSAEITMKYVKQNLLQYVLGAFVFGAGFGILAGLTTFVILSVFRKKPESVSNS